MSKADRSRRIAEIKQILQADDIALALKRRGDIHILNVFRFFGKWVPKSDPLRDAVKSVIFG